MPHIGYEGDPHAERIEKVISHSEQVIDHAAEVLALLADLRERVVALEVVVARVLPTGQENIPPKKKVKH